MKTKTANNVIGVSNILTRCPECGKLNFVTVNFPYKNKGFESTTYSCLNCGSFNVVKDNHKYDKNGFIIE